MISYCCNSCQQAIDLECDTEAILVDQIRYKNLYDKDAEWQSNQSRQAEISKEPEIHICGDCVDKFYSLF